MASLKDVAERSGVSATTVSRVLNNRGYISEQTRSKVYLAIEELDYHPNELARSLLRQRTNIIGVIFPAVDHPFFGRLLQAIELTAAKNGFKTMICVSYQDPNKEIEYLRMLKSNKVDGVILSFRTPDVSRYMDVSQPCITIDREISDSIPYVSSDHYQGGYLATKYLYHKGCRRIAHIVGSPELKLLAHRRDDAYIDCCKELGIEPLLFNSTENDFNSMDYSLTIREMLKDRTIDGVFAGSDVVAAKIIQEAMRLGIRVPEDLKVVGFDDTLIARFMSPAITTVHQPIEQVGRYAVENLVTQINGGLAPSKTVLPVHIVERGSA